MKFIDRAVITVKAGKGGDGAVSFARSRFNPRGGPDGANGGNGGSIYFRVSSSKSTLVDFEYKREYLAENGQAGGKNFKKGKDGKDLYIDVPAGIIVYNATNNKKIAELTKYGQEYCIAKGGVGGLGNAEFKTAGKRTPLNATRGKKGQTFELILELKLLADVALIGLPNAGKSTIISRISRAKPKIADYPFTTLVPNIGVVKVEETSFVVADIPGLVEGASSGVGLGIRFLKHVERTRVLAHVVDLTNDEIFKNIKLIQNELVKYSKLLSKKRLFFVFNKLDVISEEKRKEVEKTAQNLESIGIKVVFISAVRGDGLNNLVFTMKELLEESNFNRLFLYGGSFDPPHLGHKTIVENLIKVPNSKLIVMPCYKQPLKTRHSESADTRYKKLKSFFKGLDIVVSQYEILLGRTSFTVDTLKFIKEFYRIPVFLVIGLDSFCEFYKWKDFDKIIQMVNIVVFNRNTYSFIDCLKDNINKFGIEQFAIKKINRDFFDNFGITAVKIRGINSFVFFVENFKVDISSTELREHAKLQES